MPRTSPRVSFGLYALEIKQDSTPTTTTALQPFSKVLDLRTDNATSRPYATYEPNFWLLNGEYKFLPANLATVHVGLMTMAMSDENGLFTTPPVLTITFAQVHDTPGITIRGMQTTGDYANSLSVAFYDAANTLIRSDTYAPDTAEFSTGQVVAGFKRIVITFEATNRPHRYLRITGVDYGELIVFEGTAIREALVTEEVDMLSASVIINTFEMRLFSGDAAFSVINPGGQYASLKERQPLSVHEIVDNQAVYIGQFYLDTWENQSDTEIEFRCIDMLGVLDGMRSRGGLYTGQSLEVVIEALLGPIYVPYELDDDLLTIPVTGWLPICTYREALQQLAFAAGAFVTCTRSGLVRIYKTKIATNDLNPAATISRADKGLEQSLALLPLVTGAQVTGHSYKAITETRELFNDLLPVGAHEITFGEPAHDLSISGAAITASGVNYALINVATEGTVVLNGQIYSDTKKVFTVSADSLPAGVRPNVLKVEDATLVNMTNAQTVAQRIYDYYQQRYLQNMKLYAPGVEPTNTVLIDTLYNKQLRATIERMEIDLAGGMVANVRAVGVEHNG